MSRDFDLLKQLESETAKTEDSGTWPTGPAKPIADRVIQKELSQKDATDLLGEEMLRLAQTTFLSTNGLGPRQVIFCGVDEENGSSSVCASAGRAIAVMGSKSVCLVDANIRSQSLSRSLAVNTSIPFLSKASSIRDRCILIDHNLWLAGADLLTDSRGCLLPPGQLRLILQQLRDVFEYVLIDAPATTAGTEATLLGQIADAAILVVEANVTRRQTARRAKDTLEAAGVRLLGTVLRNRSFPLPQRLYKKL